MWAGECVTSHGSNMPASKRAHEAAAAMAKLGMEVIKLFPPAPSAGHVLKLRNNDVALGFGPLAQLQHLVGGVLAIGADSV